MRTAAWHLQKRRLGGLSADGARALRAAMHRLDATRRSQADPGHVKEPCATTASQGVGAISPLSSPSSNALPPAPPARVALKPGARLLREWNGRTHLVDVTDDGFVMNGKTYRSLSAVARRDHRRPLVRSEVLRTMSTLACAAPSTPASRPTKGSSRSSTRSMPSGRPVRGLHRQPEASRLEADPRPLRRRRLSRAAPWSGLPCSGCSPTFATSASMSWSSTRSTG